MEKYLVLIVYSGVLLLLTSLFLYSVYSLIISSIRSKHWWEKARKTPITNYEQITEALKRALGKKREFIIDYLTKDGHSYSYSNDTFVIEGKSIKLNFVNDIDSPHYESLIGYTFERKGDMYEVLRLIGPRGKSQLIFRNLSKKLEYWA